MLFPDPEQTLAFYTSLQMRQQMAHLLGPEACREFLLKSIDDVNRRLDQAELSGWFAERSTVEGAGDEEHPETPAET